MSYQTTHSAQLFAQAQQHIPGGVNSPVRAFKGVGGSPIFIDSAKGAYLYDVDGNRYVDFVGSWGPMILGHSAPEILAAVTERMHKGLSFGAPTAIETDMANKVCKLIPSMDMVRMVNSGTEATMSAIRLARGFTGRDKILKFEGCYHGHVDALLVKAGSGALTLGTPSSPGIPQAVTEHTLTLSYNDLEQLETCFAQTGEQLACVIIEPVAGNMNCIPAKPEFLQRLRRLCDEYQVVLIFDEVMSGFRVALGGAQAWYGITPDLTCLGKVIGGGLPVGAFGGKQAIMQYLAPLGPVYQAGTLSGNPLAMSAGLAMLNAIEEDDFYPRLEQKVNQLTDGFKQAAQQAGIRVTTNQAGSMFGLFFSEQTQITQYSQVVNQCDAALFARFFHAMLAQGVYLAPSAFEAGFMSSAHTEQDIADSVAAMYEVLPKLAL